MVFFILNNYRTKGTRTYAINSLKRILAVRCGITSFDIQFALQFFQHFLRASYMAGSTHTYVYLLLALGLQAERLEKSSNAKYLDIWVL
jgi:hypothetical protein